MKKLLVIAPLAFCLGMAAQQPSIQVFNTSNNYAQVVMGQTIYLTTTPAGNVQQIFDIKNTSSTTKTYNVKRYDITLHASATETAVAYFCFGGNCYGNTTTVSPNSLSLNGNTSASQVSGSYQMLTTDLDEIATTGLSIVKYTFINTATSSDSLQFAIHYSDPNAPVGTGIKSHSNDISSFDISPNPASSSAVVKFNATRTFNSELAVINSVGQTVIEKPLTIAEGKNKVGIETSGLPAGIYFISIKTGDRAITKKLVIN